MFNLAVFSSFSIQSSSEFILYRAVDAANSGDISKGCLSSKRGAPLGLALEVCVASISCALGDAAFEVCVASITGADIFGGGAIYGWAGG